MRRQLTAIIEKEGDRYVALCPELDIASQGDTILQARDNLREALELFFETASNEEVHQRMRDEVYVTQVEVGVGQTARSLGQGGLRYPCETRVQSSSRWDRHLACLLDTQPRKP